MYVLKCTMYVHNFETLELTICFLVQHANSVRRKHSQIMEQIRLGEYKRRAPSFAVPDADLPIRENVTPGTWSVSAAASK